MASAGFQTGSHFSSQGWPRLVGGGLGELGHCGAAHEVDAHPFDSATALSHANRFAVEKSVELGDGVVEWRKKVMRHLQIRGKQLRPLSDALLTSADDDAKHPFAQCHRGFVLYLCVLLAHPDVMFPSCCAL